MAEGFGLPLMPWQRLVADVGGELDEDGKPVYREIVVTVPRQSGKTTLVLAWELHRALLWGEPQRIAYTAQSGNAAREKLIDDQYARLIQNTPMRSSIKQVKRAMGSTALIFKNGSRIDALPTSADAGHGKTLDLAVIDEAMAETENIREQGLRPAMATRSTAQMLIPSTAGTERSQFLLHKVASGRASVQRGDTSGIAYFEWSAPDGADPNDRSVWWDCMPALGNTIDESVVAADQASMKEQEFRRAYLNQWTISLDRVVPDLLWRSVCSTSVAPKAPTVFAVDAHPDLVRAWIVAADGEAAELIDVNQEGGNVAWVVDWLVERARKFSASVALDINGPVGHFASQLELRGVQVIPYTLDGLAKACGWWWQQLGDDKLRVRSNEILDAAVGSSVRRFVGDKWLWVRSRETDTSPLMALTVAQHAASTLVTDPLSQIF